MHKIETEIAIKGHFKLTFENIHTGEKRISEYDNVNCNSCKTMIAQRLAGEENDCNITYCAVGTGIGTPAVEDETLFTELDRELLADIKQSGTSVIAYGFFGASAGNGTLTEVGLFGEDATGVADSGTMINHALINEVKSTSETLTIEIEIRML
jgi:hypothetical protein